jgi:hypothetical protein
VTKGCLDRLDAHIWQNTDFTDEEKTRSHLSANPLSSDNCLFYTRAVIALLMSAAFTYETLQYKFPVEYKFFTFWGFALTEAYFVAVMAAYARNAYRKHKGLEAPSRMWKVVSSLFHFAVTFEVVITLIYWTLLWPYEKVNSPLPHIFYSTCLVHFLPLTYLSIDFCFNSIHIEWNFVWPLIVTVFLYGQVNIIVTASTKTPVYPGLDWNCWLSWTVGLACLPFGFAAFWCLHRLSDWKYRKLGITGQQAN